MLIINLTGLIQRMTTNHIGYYVYYLDYTSNISNLDQSTLSVQHRPAIYANFGGQSR
jgi:prephenate dehydratase